MAYRFKLNEPMKRGFQRIAAEQIDRAVAHLEALDTTAVTSIHETRKCLKRTRALLRFCRPNMEGETFKLLNTHLRDIGRSLSETRDANVLNQTIAGLAHAGRLKPAVVARLQAATALAQDATERQLLDATANREILARLASVRDEISSVELEVGTSSIDTSGLARSFHACHAAFEPAFDGADELAIHEWRKSVQTHWRHMQLIKLAWPAYCEARIDEARSISALIGELRDLGLLMNFASGPASTKLTPTMIASITAIIGSRQTDLKREAKLRGGRLLRERANGVSRRLQDYWAAAVELKRMRSGSKSDA